MYYACRFFQIGIQGTLDRAILTGVIWLRLEGCCHPKTGPGWGLTFLGLLGECLCRRWLGFLTTWSMWPNKPSRSCSAFYDLASEVVHCHSCPVLVITQDESWFILRQDYTRLQILEVWIFRGHLDDWLPTECPLFPTRGIVD